LVVDPDAETRASVSALLGRVGYATREAAGGVEALATVRAERPALVLLEIRLPDIAGYEVCRELREEWGEQLPIFFLSADRIEAIDRLGGLLLGADDFIVKPFDPDELLARVRRVVGRPTRRPTEGERSQDAEALTAREQEVLELLASGLRQEQIAERLSVTGKTIATHIQRMLTKLNVHSRAELVAIAYREGRVSALEVAGRGQP
jgi:DNA-binding NarL/FixJ family response regulator